MAAPAAATTKSRSEVERISAHDLARELGEVSRGALAFDGDGTLWSGDVGEDFFFGVLDSGKLTDVAAGAIARAARDAGIEEGASPSATARRIYDAYLRGEFDEERVCEVMTWVNAGWTHAATTAFVLALVSAAFTSRVHPEVASVIAAARAQGHEIFVVSASPRPIVEAAAAVCGIPAAHVLAATAVLEGDRYAASVHRPIPYGAGKAAALRQNLGDLPLRAAFGDNAFDGEMLAMSERPIAVRPKQRLIDRAADIPKLRVLTE